MLLHQFADGIDQLDDELGAVVSRRSLGAEQIGARRELHFGMIHDQVVEHEDAQRVHQLPLILVQALGLRIKHRARVDDRALMGLDKARQALLVRVP